MIRLEISGNYYPIYDSFTIKKSSREVSFNTLTINFTGKMITDLPYKYQECHIIEYDTNDEEELIQKGSILFTGYVSSFELPSMKLENETRKLSIELISPMKLATLRTINAVGTYYLQNLLYEICDPLINDGFNILEMNVGNNQVTVNYLCETCETALNRLSNKFNFWWYIDENKGIHINDITYQLQQTPVLTYDSKLDGLFTLTPSMDATDYCNVVNFTNVRVYTYAYYDYDLNEYKPLFDHSIQIKKDDTIEFNYPVDIKPSNVTKSYNSQSYEVSILQNVALTIQCTDSTGTSQSFTITSDGESISLPSNVQIGDSDNTENQKTWILYRDSFYSNLITSVKYTGSNTITNITILGSCSALMWTRLKFMNNKEIAKMKGHISATGIVEKTIDMNETWKTYPELTDIANSYVNTSASRVDQIEMEFDKDYNLDVGDVIEINKPNFMIQDKYIITDLDIQKKGIYSTWSATLRNANYLENFIDLFRSTEEETTEDKVYNLVVSNYDNEEIKEVHEVE